MNTGEPRSTEHEPEDVAEDIAAAQQTHSLVDALTRGQRRRIAELDAKYDAILTAIEDRFVARLDQVDGRLIGGVARLDEIEERLTVRLESLESSMAELLRRLPSRS